MAGREGISRLYAFDVLVASHLPEQQLRPLAIAQSARLVMRVAGKTRVVHGIVSRIREDGMRVSQEGGGSAVHRYWLRLVPRAWLLRRRKTSRIFQNKRIDEIVDEVASQKRVPIRWQLAKPLPSRPHCTQFEETDFAFIKRLCAENGLFFHFEQPLGLDEVLEASLGAAQEALGPLVPSQLGELMPPHGDGAGEVLVISDFASYPPLLSAGAPGSMSPTRPTLHVRDAGGALTGRTHEDSVSEAVFERSVRPSGALYREYDPMRPLAELEVALGGAGMAVGEALAGLGAAALAVGSSPPGLGPFAQAIRAAVDPQGLDIYEHDGRDLYPDWDTKKNEPELILAQHRRRAVMLRAASHAVGIESGKSFHLEGHAADEANRDYAVVEVLHEGTASYHDTDGSAPYANRFACVPRETVYMPKRPERRSVQVCMTALVVGPRGEEIHVNERGEIRVKFYWDRRPDLEEPTCWIRTMHPWAGATWGSQFIPRVGMEVVVAFEGGDPDKPLVLGSVYNGILPPPFALPGHKTRSGIRTRSTPHGGGHNELSFEDAKGGEQVYLRAERDFDSLVQRDRTSVVQHQDHTTVIDDQHLTVTGAQHVHVTRARDVHLASDDMLHVAGARHVRVDHGLEERLGSRSVHVAGVSRSHLGGDCDVAFGGNVVALADGNVAMMIGKSEAPRSCTLAAEGGVQVSARQTIDIASDKEVLLRCGTSFIRLADGEIEISADKVTVRGKDARLLLDAGDAKLKAKGKWQVVADDAIVLKASGASIGLQSEAKVDGSKVLLNSPESASDDIEVTEPNPTTIEVVDEDGNPVANQRFRIELSGGGEQMGFTDEEGKAVVHIEGSGQITFPDLSEVEEA